MGSERVNRESEIRARMGEDYDGIDQLIDTDPIALGEFTRELLAEVVRLRTALRTLEQWDMLTLDKDGHGAATADAPWARALIAAALREDE